MGVLMQLGFLHHSHYSQITGASAPLSLYTPVVNNIEIAYQRNMKLVD